MLIVDPRNGDVSQAPVFGGQPAGGSERFLGLFRGHVNSSTHSKTYYDRLSVGTGGIYIYEGRHQGWEQLIAGDFCIESAAMLGRIDPWLEVDALVAGAASTFTVTNAQPGDHFYVLYSLRGAGPSEFEKFGTHLYPTLSYRILELPYFVLDSNGNGSTSFSVPPGTQGYRVWIQGYSSGWNVLNPMFTNATSLVVQ